ERRQFLADEVRELSAGRIDEDEELVVEIIKDVGPTHLDGLADDLLLVLVERDEDAFLAVLQAASDELCGQRRLAGAGSADYHGRAVLVHPSVQEWVESIDSTPNLTHAISSRREPDKRADLRIRHAIESLTRARWETTDEALDHLSTDPEARDSRQPLHALAAAERRDGCDDLDR